MALVNQNQNQNPPAHPQMNFPPPQWTMYYARPGAARKNQPRPSWPLHRPHLIPILHEPHSVPPFWCLRLYSAQDLPATALQVVGQTMCGKTVCSATLKGALQRLHDDPEVDPEHENAFYQHTHWYIMNPKSVSMGELYGEVNDVTQEWTDGILSNIARTAVRGDGTPSRCWITFDGPVDAVWIENMNTVLDDNKMLCLVNGERIKIPEHVTFCFEVQDLRVASPATVSRCGMVLIEPYQLEKGWGLLAKRTNRALAAKYAACGPCISSFLSPVANTPLQAYYIWGGPATHQAPMASFQGEVCRVRNLDVNSHNIGQVRFKAVGSGCKLAGK